MRRLYTASFLAIGYIAAALVVVAPTPFGVSVAAGVVAAVCVAGVVWAVLSVYP